MELLPCPFCGSHLNKFGHGFNKRREVVDLFIHPNIEKDDYRCPLNGLVFIAEAWNTRTPEGKE